MTLQFIFGFKVMSQELEYKFTSLPLVRESGHGFGSLRKWKFHFIRRSHSHQYTLSDNAGNRVLVSAYFYHTQLKHRVGRVSLGQQVSRELFVYNKIGSSLYTVSDK